MKQRLGAFLCILLGAVLITTGLTSNSGGDIGGVVPSCGEVAIGIAVPCPTGTISFTETTTGTGATPPANWTVHITSTCLDPATGLPVDMTVSVPDGGTNSSGPLEVFTTNTHSTSCSYTYVEDPVPAHFTATFAPTSPQVIPFSGGSTNSGLKVDLTNAYTAPTPTTSAPASSSAAATPTATATTSPAPTTEPVANTGPHEQIRASVWIGVALCALGLVLLVAGRRRRGASHAD